jgi:LAO/AO transport system kinase
LSLDDATQKAAGAGAGLQALAARVLAGERGGLARALTRIERDAQDARALDAALAPHTGRAYTVGITGAPGAGKSTLVGALLGVALAHDQRVAVLALDPESPLTHGAILGDRLRMEHVAADERVFVRSMTADAHGGGLSVTTPLAMRALDAAGWPWVFVETVGVGQTELDIVDAAATTVVVLNPGWGDEVQAVKAGLMEVADIFVINKCDREGAAQTRRDLEQLLAATKPAAWRPLIVETVANAGRGIEETWAAIATHRAHLESSGALTTRRARFLTLALRGLAQAGFQSRLDAWSSSPQLAQTLERLGTGEQTLHEAAGELLRQVLRQE